MVTPMDTPSQEAFGSVIDKVFSGQLKHVREAKDLIKQCGQVTASSTKSLTNVSIASVVRPDTEVGKHPVKYCGDLLKFLQAFHDQGLFRTHRKWIEEMNKLYKGLDFSSHEAFKDSLIAMAKKAPESELDKIPSNLRCLPGHGTIERIYAPANTLGEDHNNPLPEFSRFLKPASLINETYSSNVRKPYSGNGELAVLSPDEIKKVLQVYVDAEQCFSMATKIQNSAWPMMVSVRKKVLSLYGADSEYKLWSRNHEDKALMAVYGSYDLMHIWTRGSKQLSSWALSNTRPQQNFLEAMFRWAKASHNIHLGNVSQESLPIAFKW